MSNDPADSLSDLSDLKLVEGIDPADTAQDAALRRELSRATLLIQAECHRVFLPSNGAQTFAAPWGSTLFIPDATTVTAVTAWGADLVAGTDYMKLLSPDGRSIQGLYRLGPGFGGGNWTPDPPVGNPRTAIVVTGAWGFTTIPADLVDLNQALAAILFRDRGRLYADDEGSLGTLGSARAVLHLIPEKLRTIFTIYWRPPIAQVIGA